MRTSLALFVLLVAACGSNRAASSPPRSDSVTPTYASADGTSLAPALPAGRAQAIFAGGCFWCVEAAFEGLDGVTEVLSGYTGGSEQRPTYRQVSSGSTGHFEAVRVVYDPTRITYASLLEVFLHNIDPVQDDGQFCDHGRQYRSAIFVGDASERAAARALLDRASRELGRMIATQVRDAGPFWVAESYHQDYYRTHPVEYLAYRTGCGRDDRLRELWGDRAGHAGH